MAEPSVEPGAIAPKVGAENWGWLLITNIQPTMRIERVLEDLVD